jgi:hypothetical protein
MVITRASQARDGGSIPLARLRKNPDEIGGFFLLGKGEGNRTEGARPLGRERTRMVSASDRGGLEGTNRKFVTGRRFPSLAFKKVGIVRRAAPTFF